MKGRLRTVYSPYAHVKESGRNEKALADHTPSNAALSDHAFEKDVEKRAQRSSPSRSADRFFFFIESTENTTYFSRINTCTLENR